MSRPAPAGAIVAVLERRGRFMTASRLFPESLGGEGGRHGRPGSRGGGGIVVGPARAAGAEAGREGDLVLVALAGRGGRGTGARVLRRLGRPEVARDLLEGLMLDRGLARGFDAAVEREAEEAAQRIGRGLATGARRDLRELPTFTVDPVSARDFDDAVSAEALPSGRARIWIHIADVAAHVPEGSLLDREARRRSTSVYVPGAVEPMLPHALSSEACSLLPGQDRAAVTTELELDGAQVVSASFYRSVIRSDERLDYDRLDRIFAGEERAAEPWGAPIEVARAAAAALGEARASSGALTIDSPEPEVRFDEHGDVEQIQGRVQTESHRLIEHLMIAANEAVASFLSKRGTPCLYRVHERPDPERVVRLADQLASLEVPTPPLPEPLSSTQAADALGAISTQVEQHLTRTAGRGRLALNALVLRSLKQAYYSPRNIGHAGLHSSYCHFTSPIRRYPDIVCHRALLSAVGAGTPQGGTSEREPRAGELSALAEWTSEREREAMVLERDADRVVSCFALEQELREVGPEHVFAGEIAGLISAGAFVAFSPAGLDQEGAPPYEGMLPVRLLRAPSERPSRAPAARGAHGSHGRGRGARAGGGHRGRDDGPQGDREWWELNEEGTILRGERTGATLRLGQEIEVRVGRIDSVRGRVDLEPAS